MGTRQQYTKEPLMHDQIQPLDEITLQHLHPGVPPNRTGHVFLVYTIGDWPSCNVIYWNGFLREFLDASSHIPIDETQIVRWIRLVDYFFVKTY